MIELTPAFTELLERARAAAEAAYCPYSGLAVGAAVRGANSLIYTGCNVENASFGATLCAERSAIAHMVQGGERRMLAAAVYADTEHIITPCGICRQVLSEFGRGAHLIVANRNASEVLSLAELLPRAFEFRRPS